jgi:hypothetical protein
LRVWCSDWAAFRIVGAGLVRFEMSGRGLLLARVWRSREWPRAGRPGELVCERRRAVAAVQRERSIGRAVRGGRAV